MSESETESAAVRLSCDGTAYTAAMERVMEQAERAAHLSAFRRGIGRTPESTPERTARLAALPVTHRARKVGDRWQVTPIDPPPSDEPQPPRER